MIVTSASTSIFPSATNRIFAKVADFSCECDHSFNLVREFEKGKTHKLEAMNNAEVRESLISLLCYYLKYYYIDLLFKTIFILCKALFLKTPA